MTVFDNRLPEDALPEPVVMLPVQRYVDGAIAAAPTDHVAAEVPVALVFNGISHAVMMCTPQDLPELAVGFALSEGIIESADDCYDIETVLLASPATVSNGLMQDLPAVEMRLEIASESFTRLKERRRALAGRTGCGVCGVENLQALGLDLAVAMKPPAWLQGDLGAVSQAIFRALAAMPAQQLLNSASGALHAAGYAGSDGQLLAVYEDVGRHNALDKLLGARAMADSPRWQAQVATAAQRRQWPQEGFVVMTSRASYELVRKCARLQVPLLATISAPTAMAIQVAQAAGVQLWGLARQPRAVLYTSAM